MDIDGLHKKLFDLLSAFDKVCEENSLTYWLDGGTALGAVRHKGFIPWDDDVDVAMPYDDYKKFLKLPRNCFPINIELQLPKECNQHFAKLRDCTSTFLEIGEIPTEKYNQGIYLDIFPMISYPNFSIFKRKCKVKEFIDLWTFIQNCNKKKIINFRKKIEFSLKSFIWKVQTSKKSKIFANFPEDNGYNIIHYYKDLYPLKKIQFESGQFYVPNNVNNYLSDLYKDYMTLPPEEKRKTHVNFFDLTQPSLYIQKQKIKNDLAPVAIFVFNRIRNTKKTISYLKRNYLAEKTNIFIFSNAAKSHDKKNQKRVKRLRKYLKTIKGFNSVTIIERKENFYIEKNIIDGINYIFKNNEKLIVLEDDVLTSKNFLLFMNNCLNIYEKQNNIAQIAGWQIVPNLDTDFKTIFWNYLEISGGWATWKNRWENFKYYKTEQEALSDMSLDEIKKIQFHNTFPCLCTLKLNPIPWDICWFISIIKNKQLTVNPSKSLTRNIGLYNGSHFSSNKFLKKSKFDTRICNNSSIQYSILNNNYSIYEAKLEAFFLKSEYKDTLLLKGIKIFFIPLKILKIVLKRMNKEQ